MRTIFLTSFHILISRNILAAPVFRDLADAPGIAIVLFVPAGKERSFAERFSRGNVKVVGVSRALSRRDLLLRLFAIAALRSRTNAIKRRAEYAATGDALRFAAKTALAWLAAGRTWSRWLLRRCDRLLLDDDVFRPYFEEHRPAFVFSTDVQNEADLALLRGARLRGIPSVGMVRSWDNLTAKGLLRVVPDVLVVANEIVRGEALRLNNVAADRIRVIGVPHYDAYGAAHVTSREAFCRARGLEPQKPIIFVAPIGNRYVCEFRAACVNRTDRFILETLVVAREDGRLPRNLQFLVRLPPADAVDLPGFALPPGVVIEQPGSGGTSAKERELSPEDDVSLRDSLAHAALVVSGPSTVVIDAALFDRPIVIPDFDAAPRPYAESIRRFYDYDHFRLIMAAGGAADCRDPDSFVAAIAAALADARLGRPGRERIVREQCWRRDGRASERLLAILRERLAA